MFKLLYSLAAAGTALTNSTSETVLASYEIPAYGLQAGQVIGIEGAVIATTTNSTDTLTVDLAIGPTSLTGTVIGTSGAVDVANNDKITWDISCVVRDADSSSVVLCYGSMSVLGAEGTATHRVAFEQLALDSGVAQKIEVTGTWSVASASNSCRADALVITGKI